MTKKERLIEMIMDGVDLSRELVKKVFEIINEKDWVDFCSQMADDGDHPEERLEGERVMNFKLQNLNPQNESTLASNIALIRERMNTGEWKNFYNRNFHSMDKEFEG